MKEHLFDSFNSLNTALAEAIEKDLSTQLKTSANASIAVSGGKTPIAMYEQLSMADLAWQNVTITLTDERWLPNHHPDSNERMVKQYLINNKAAAARFIPLKTSSNTAEDGQESLDKTLGNELPSVDIVVLGMGADGHFASLFPHTIALEQGLDAQSSLKCIAACAPVEPKERMSLTLSMLLTAKKIYLLISGDDKLAVYRGASQLDSDDRLSLPISAVLTQSDVPVALYWSPVSR